MKKIMVILASICASNALGMSAASGMYIANPQQGQVDRAQLHMAHLRVVSPEPGRRVLLGAGIENTGRPPAHSAAGAPIVIAQASQAHLLVNNDELYDADQSYNQAAHAQDFDHMGLPIGAEPHMYEEARDEYGRIIYRLKAEHIPAASASASESAQRTDSHAHNDALQAQQQVLKAIDESAKRSHHENVQQHQSTHAATAAAAQPAPALIPAKPQPARTQDCCIIA